MTPRNIILSAAYLLMMICVTASPASASMEHGVMDSQSLWLENATVVSVKEDVVVFTANRENRMMRIFGTLTGDSKILDEQGWEIDIETMKSGGIWNVSLEYPLGKEGIPEIIEMTRVKKRPR